MSKKAFLALALEEVGLVAGETPVGTVHEEYADATVDDILEEAEAEQEEVAEKVAEIDAASEVQEGLEALVASMESALADPNYSAREYQLQVSHAATLLGRIGLGLPAGLSCESTDGAEAAKEGFADKAKKIGKAVSDALKKFFAWLVESGKKLTDRLVATLGKFADLVKTGKWNKDAEVEFETEAWPGYEFDPEYPLAQLYSFDKWHLDVLKIFIGYAASELSKETPESLKHHQCDELAERLKNYKFDGPGQLTFGTEKAERYYHVAKAEVRTFKFKAGAVCDWKQFAKKAEENANDLNRLYQDAIKKIGPVYNDCPEFVRMFHNTQVHLENFRRQLASTIIKHCRSVIEAGLAKDVDE